MDARSSDWTSPLDPQDWALLRQQGHAMLDDMLAFIEAASAGSGPVWQPAPDAARASIVEPIPQQGTSLDEAYGVFKRHILPYAVGNTHPGFMGWVHGAGSAVGMLAEMLAAGLNANLGGRDHMPVALETQVVRWMAELFRFPASASGLFVTGSSMANLIGVLVARTRALGAVVRSHGLQQPGRAQLTAYASRGAHGCVARAMDISGLGSGQLRLVEQDADGAIDTAALQRVLEADRQAGLRPFLIVGTAGSVDTGAIDPLDTLADIATDAGVHFHVDGAFGALCVLAPDLAHKVKGIERADSIAMDFHKWLHVPYDAGFVLVRDGRHQLAAFDGGVQSYLAREPGGMSAGSPWPCDLGPDLSRGFRALKTWMTLKVYGTETLGQAISDSCERARYLAGLVECHAELELLAPVSLNIVCFRYRAPEDTVDGINQQLLLAIQHAGIAAPSSTRLAGSYAIRAALLNHRTRRGELDRLIDFVIAKGRVLVGRST